jgi:hypothetical protein
VDLGEEAPLQPLQIEPADAAAQAAEQRPGGVDAADGLLSMLLPKGAIDPVGHPARRPAGLGSAARDGGFSSPLQEENVIFLSAAGDFPLRGGRKM